MITQLALRNFKSWRDTGAVRLAPVTAFFGSNSSGKTSLLQALLLLKQTAESSDRGQALHFGDAATLVRLGDFASVVSRHATESRLSLGLQWELDRPFPVKDSAAGDRPVVESRVLTFDATVRATNGAKGAAPRLSVAEMTYAVGNARFGMRGGAEGKGKYEVFAEDVEFALVRSVGRPSTVPPPSKCYGFPDQVRANYQNAGFLADLELALEDCLRTVYYLGPLRAYPERQYPWTGAQPEDVGQAGERAVDALLAARERGVTISPGYKKRHLSLEVYVARWLQQLGLIHDFRVERIAEGSQLYQVKVRQAARSPEVLITDVGFGVSQVLPVLVLCFYVPPGATIILEQPEIHLHPSVQAGLADVFIDAHRRRGVQVLVESHSEHLLRRLQRRVADESLQASEVALYFCENTDGVSVLRNLNVDLLGNITNYPADFFGDQLGEVATITREQIRRRRESA